jgi:hypothetical protein
MTQSSLKSTTEYFLQEGKSNLRDCVRIAFESAVNRGIQAIVMFTGIGEGPTIAIHDFLNKPEFAGIRVVAVTFPYGQRFENDKGVELSDDTRKMMGDNGVALIRAHLPFNPIAAHYRNHGILGQDLTLIGNALSIFGGSMSLCVQAAIMACDAGLFQLGDHVISMTSDTAVIVRTAPTERLLTDFIIREILCKPLYLTIGKGEDLLEDPALESSVEEGDAVESPSSPQILPPSRAD